MVGWGVAENDCNSFLSWDLAHCFEDAAATDVLSLSLSLSLFVACCSGASASSPAPNQFSVLDMSLSGLEPQNFCSSHLTTPCLPPLSITSQAGSAPFPTVPNPSHKTRVPAKNALKQPFRQRQFGFQRPLRWVSGPYMSFFPKALRRVLPENPLNTDTSTLTLTH